MFDETSMTSSDSGVVRRQSGGPRKMAFFWPAAMSPCQRADLRPSSVQYRVNRAPRLFSRALIGQMYKRLSPGQALPPHTHGTSDLFLYVAEGAGELDTPNGPVPLVAGDLAQYRGDEELRVASTAEEGMTLLAFLAPEFPRPDAP